MKSILCGYRSVVVVVFFFFSSRRRHTRCYRDWSSDVCSSDLLTGGRLIRGLHHWGASMMIVVVVIHMLQVFLWGAYKRPREATWMAGVGLMLLDRKSVV